MDKQDEEFSRGMVVVAHADDAEFGCSGTVAKLCAEGWEMVYVMCTDGSKGSSDREITQAELAAIRREEQINAGRVLGLKDVVFLDYEDSLLQPTLEPAQGHSPRDSPLQAGCADYDVPDAQPQRWLGRRASRPHGGGPRLRCKPYSPRRATT